MYIQFKFLLHINLISSLYLLTDLVINCILYTKNYCVPNQNQGVQVKFIVYFFIVMSIANLLSLKVATAAEKLPTEFSHNQIYLTPQLTNDHTLRIFTDTGGGWNAMRQSLYKQYQWPTDVITENGQSMEMAALPAFKAGASIPGPGINNALNGKVFVVDDVELTKLDQIDGFLGGRWHAEKVLSFNYLTQQMHLLAKANELDLTQFNKIKLGFQKNAQGNYTMAFPSLNIKVKGQVIPVLFDTGASAYLSDNAKKQLKVTASKVGTSFMAASVFDKWRSENPDWPVIDGADRMAKEAMILVPEVEIDGKKVGPVWFTRRQDKNFHQFMSSMMDTQVDGAIGGSLLQYTHIVVDYPNEVAYIKL